MSLSDRIVIRFADGDEISEVWSANSLKYCVIYAKLHPSQKIVKVFRRMPGMRVYLTQEFHQLMRESDGR